jgi:hypothetical protein
MAWKLGKNDATQARAEAATAGDVSDRFGAVDRHEPSVWFVSVLCIDWQSFEQTLGSTYHPSQGAPGISTRLMVALHYLKYQHDLSDEDVVALWVENPYWQHFSGMRFSASDADRSFEHDALAQAAGRCRSRADAACDD